MMKRVKAWWLRMTMPRGMAQRRPMVIVRRADAEAWTEADQMWVSGVVEHPIWRKLMRFSDDSICCDVLEGGGDRTVHPEWLKGFVAGRKAQMDYEQRHGMLKDEAKPPDPERDWQSEPTREDKRSERSVIEENPER